jgi:hypothetical protein
MGTTRPLPVLSDGESGACLDRGSSFLVIGRSVFVEKSNRTLRIRAALALGMGAGMLSAPAWAPAQSARQPDKAPAARPSADTRRFRTDWLGFIMIFLFLPLARRFS